MTHYNPAHRPLIDQIPDHVPDHDLDVSDEEDNFYSRDEDDYLIHPKWRALVAQATSRVPRRVQRHSGLYGICLFLLILSWVVYFRPRHSAIKEENRLMDQVPEHGSEKSRRPEFGGLVQVKSLEPGLLPKGESRLVIVGDVHGCKEELEHLLRKTDFVEGRDHLILTGDIVSKGPDSPGVVSLASQLPASCVRGNHEDKLLLYAASLESYSDPAITSPAQMLPERSTDKKDRSLHDLAKSLSVAQMTYLQSCPVILDVGVIGDLGHVLVVHAGLVPDVPLRDQDPFQVMNMRTIDLKTHLPSETRDYTPWEKFWNRRQQKKNKHERSTVIYGHDKKRGLNIQKWSMGLDSGCVSGGHLTAVVIGEAGKHEFVQVKCRGHVD